jgi:hypothetical protein
MEIWTLQAERVEATKYEAIEGLRDGRPITIRALRPDDREGLLAAVASSSTQSLYRAASASKSRAALKMGVTFLRRSAKGPCNAS